MQDCPDSARVVVADQLARSTLLADNLRVKSKVHPKYKTKYHGGNWPEYEQALVRRGDVTLWLSAEAMDAWRPAPSGRPGGPRKFSDVSIMTALMLRLVFRLPLRQTEGFLRSVLALMRTDLEAPDHTTLSRRSQHLDLALDRIPAQRPVHLIVDSTGLSIVGKGEWAAVKHGNRSKRGWKKLHFGVDRSGVIVAQAVTEPTADDATTGISLIEQVDGDIASVTADAAYEALVQDCPDRKRHRSSTTAWCSRLGSAVSSQRSRRRVVHSSGRQTRPIRFPSMGILSHPSASGSSSSYILATTVRSQPLRRPRVRPHGPPRAPASLPPRLWRSWVAFGASAINCCYPTLISF